MTKENILIVEDNEVLREGIEEMLIGEGFSVISAGDGKTAMDAIKTWMPDLILSDINMPEMDGFEFFNLVRSNQEWLAIPFIFLTARSETDDVLAGRNLGAEDYLTKPISRDELVTTIQSRLNRSHEVQVAQLQQAFRDSLTALANAIEARSTQSFEHVERVTELSLTLGTYLNWQPNQLEDLRFGAILHDLGKIQISESILFKKSPLSDDEWEAIKNHPLAGAQMVRDVPQLKEAVSIVLFHHERWDGKGYPDGLSAEEIPEGARILAVADSFDAMTMDRPYRQACSLDEARKELFQLSGSNYDPGVLGAFQRAWDDGKIHPIYGEN